jgi:hypothetical protein
VVLLGAMVLGTGGGLGWFWWRYQQSAKTSPIVAESINQHQSGALQGDHPPERARQHTSARGSAASSSGAAL